MAKCGACGRDIRDMFRHRQRVDFWDFPMQYEGCVRCPHCATYVRGEGMSRHQQTWKCLRSRAPAVTFLLGSAEGTGDLRQHPVWDHLRSLGIPVEFHPYRAPDGSRYVGVALPRPYEAAGERLQELCELAGLTDLERTRHPAWCPPLLPRDVVVWDKEARSNRYVYGRQHLDVILQRLQELGDLTAEHLQVASALGG